MILMPWVPFRELCAGFVNSDKICSNFVNSDILNLCEISLKDGREAQFEIKAPADIQVQFDLK